MVALPEKKLPWVPSARWETSVTVPLTRSLTKTSVVLPLLSLALGESWRLN